MVEDGIDQFRFNKVNYNPLFCDSRKWKKDKSPYHQCNVSKKKGIFCIRCYNKKLDNRLWEGLITEPPPDNPICIAKSGKKTIKYWVYPLENDHFIDNKIIDKVDTDTSKKEATIIKKKIQLNKNDHKGAPFSGLLEKNDTTKEREYNFEDYEDITIDHKNYKMNNYDNQILDINRRKIIIIGIWDKETGTIIKE